MTNSQDIPPIVSDSVPEQTNQKPTAQLSPVRILIYALLVLGVIVGVVFIVLSNQPMISKQALTETNFPVYVPKRIPPGYQLSEESVSATSEVVSYSLVGDQADNSFTITVQPTPGRFNMAQLIEGGQVKGYQTSSGTLYDLTTSKSYQYLLDTGDTLVFITSKNATDIATVKSIAENLTRVD